MAKGTVNKVILLGRLGKDPEVRMTASNTKIAKVSLATNEIMRQNNNQEVITDWHNLVFFGKLADFAESYLKKGALVYVEGKLRTRQWTDQGNNTRYSTEVIVDSIQFVGSSPRGSEVSGQVDEPLEDLSAQEPDEALPEVSEEDDIPF